MVKFEKKFKYNIHIGLKNVLKCNFIINICKINHKIKQRIPFLLLFRMQIIIMEKLIYLQAISKYFSHNISLFNCQNAHYGNLFLPILNLRRIHIISVFLCKISKFFLSIFNIKIPQNIILYMY
jgi:hypothetical protein